MIDLLNIGSVYHWAGMIVPKQWTPVAAYVCGWANFLGNAAGDAAFAASWSCFVSAASETAHGIKYSVEGQVGLSIFILTIWTFLNCFNISHVGWVNSLAGMYASFYLLFFDYF